MEKFEIAFTLNSDSFDINLFGQTEIFITYVAFAWLAIGISAVLMYKALKNGVRK